MHLGRTYPFLFEHWQAWCFFWPGFVPRKLHVSCPAGFGTSWARLAGGVVTGIGQPDAFSIGDPKWTYTDPGLAWQLRVLLHRVNDFPCRYSITASLEEVGPVVTSEVYGEVSSPQYAFSGWTFTFASNFPPFSLGVVPPLQIRAATWSEV